MNTADKIERIKFLQRNIGDWSEADADDVCKMALEALTPVEAPAETGVRERLASVLYNNVFGGTADPTLDENLQGLCLSQADAIIAAFSSLSGGVLTLEERLKLLPIGDMERETALTFFDLVKHGSKFINLHVRKDGKEYHFQADWLKALLRDLDAPSESTRISASPTSAPTTPDTRENEHE